MSEPAVAAAAAVRSTDRPPGSTPVPEDALAKPDNYYSIDRSDMLPSVPVSARRILEVGCGEGGFGRLLRARRGDITLLGMEPEPSVAGAAAAHYDELIVGRYPEDLPAGITGLHCVVFNDVLEHLVDPWDALRVLHGRLAVDGVVVASIPNLRYLPVLYGLVVRGRFDYVSAGVLDRTHLRFFTRRSIAGLFEATGYAVESVRGLNPYRDRWQVRLLRMVAPGFVEDIRFQQYAVVARPTR